MSAYFRAPGLGYRANERVEDTRATHYTEAERDRVIAAAKAILGPHIAIQILNDIVQSISCQDPPSSLEMLANHPHVKVEIVDFFTSKRSRVKGGPIIDITRGSFGLVIDPKTYMIRSKLHELFKTAPDLSPLSFNLENGPTRGSGDNDDDWRFQWDNFTFLGHARDCKAILSPKVPVFGSLRETKNIQEMFDSDKLKKFFEASIFESQNWDDGMLGEPENERCYLGMIQSRQLKNQEAIPVWGRCNIKISPVPTMSSYGLYSMSKNAYTPKGRLPGRQAVIWK